MNFSAVKKMTIPEGEVKQIMCGDVVLWKKGCTNLVPTSIDSDGSIFNGTGYIDGNRLSSSGALKAQDNTVTTGFIKATQNDVVRMAGTKWDVTPGYNYFAMYDANFNLIVTINRDKSGGGYYNTHGWSYASNINRLDFDNTTVAIENGVVTFKVSVPAGYEYSYIRISANGTGADMIVTVNEEIE